MRSAFVVLAAIAATVIAGSPAAAAEPKFRDKPLVQKAGILRLSSDAVADRGGSKVFIVQMAGDPAIRYQGGVSGFAKSAPAKGERYDARSSQAQMYTERLGQQQEAVLARVGASGGKIYSFRHVFNGFAARMTAQQAAKLRKDKNVLQVWEDQAMPLDTNNSPRFLGLLNESNGLRTKHGLRGKDVIIGMLDSGIVQEHPSLDPTGYQPPPAGWAGACEAGDGFAATDCNNKLIGARFYVDGFGAANVVPTEFLSPRDSDGHGTHTATTAAGNANVQAVLAGMPVATISGIAPRARVAAYKVCWQAPGAPSSSCFFSDSAAATDQAVADGVDILSFSVGTAFSFIDPQDIAFLFATDAGIFVSRSAGNEGPGPESVAAGEPWVTSVAASTHSGTLFANATEVNSPKSVAGTYASLESGISRSLQETGPITDDLIAASPIDACLPLTNSLTGGIGLIARGDCDFSVKLTNAANAGAMGVLMYTNANPKTVMGGTATPESLSIPAVMIDNAPGLEILAALTGGETVNVTLSADNFVRERMKGNIMAGFSSRGPFPTVRDWIKPDLTAPGVNVLAGATPEPNDGSFGGFFQYLSGTSMSTPHIAGIAALLRQAHPDWTPAMIKSAMMTTSRQNVWKEDGVTKADPFDFGAGHVNPNRAINPGLVYDAGFLDYLAGACGTSEAAGLFADPAATCASLEGAGFSTDASDLNLPSIGIADLPGRQTVTRHVTNVGKGGSRYDVSVESPKGYRTQVKPASMWLKPGETTSYTVTFTNRNAPPGEWRFGSLEWNDDKGHSVRSPIALRGQALVAPDVIQGTGESGSDSFNVTFGYSGAYAAGAHGLVEPILTGPIVIEDDPVNSFDFNFGADEPIVYAFDAPPGAAALEFSTFDAYNDNPGHDLDMYVFYCPNFLCTQVGASLNATSNESVRVPFPSSDPAIDDPYVVFLHGFNTAGGAPATSIFFDWTVEGPAGNLTVTGPTTAEIAQEGAIDLQWSGLMSGAAFKYRGAVSHSDGTTIQDATAVEIDNDAGNGFCDFFACP